MPTDRDLREISLATARELIDFGAGQGAERRAAEEQLAGSVALHNVLVREGFAYLADEVGMGKTFVALGAASLFRHFHPDWRVLYVAPSENLQAKWAKELRNFTAQKWRVIDNRVCGFQDESVVELVQCKNLLDLAHQAALNPARDFIVRMSSFSLPLSEGGGWVQKRDALREKIDWLKDDLFDLRDKAKFKKQYASAINLVLPHFDLVVVDEGHNLKHGLGAGVAARNRMLATVLGSAPDISTRDFVGYGRRFERVLVLSATPLENDYRQLYNQLDLFGFGARWPVLNDPDPDRDAEKQTAVRDFLLRRITTMSVGGRPWTKNLYRREWRGGGVDRHDDGLQVADERQRLIVALVQKKVAEVIGSARFNYSFQIGMLASFESFLETSRAKAGAGDDEDTGNFDDADQTESRTEREGIDTGSINSLARSYHKRFGTTLPHPKMDAVALGLSDAFASGDKALAFTRRVRSVDELAEKLNRHYDETLQHYLLAQIQPDLAGELEGIFASYEAKRRDVGPLRATALTAAVPTLVETPREVVDEAEAEAQSAPDDEPGDFENFFAWFFRGESGPPGILSGAQVRKNRLGEGSAYGIFFEDNVVAWLLGGAGDVLAQLGAALEPGRLAGLRDLGFTIFRRDSRQRKFQRLRVYNAYQEAAVHLLADHALDAGLKDRAGVVRSERFSPRPTAIEAAPENFPQPEDLLGEDTFFSALAARPELCAALWPDDGAADDFRARYRRRELRRELAVAAIRLGHPYIDLWLDIVAQLGALRTKDAGDGDGRDLARRFLDRLEAQRAQGGHTSYRELAEIAAHFDLILSTNFSTARSLPFSDVGRHFTRTLSRQTPVAGMAGQVNRTVVTQFRMPGYPLVLVTTDILQEGEDLHTFCRRVVHYGIAWTPSSMEQRTGRVDRLGSLTRRRLDGADRAAPDELLQVYYPHLADTIERLQVERVYERMNRFIRMLHKSLAAAPETHSKVDAKRDIVLRPRDIRPITDALDTLYPVRPDLLHTEDRAVPITAGREVDAQLAHFERMVEALKARAALTSVDLRAGTGTLNGRALVDDLGRLYEAGAAPTDARSLDFRLLLRAVSGSPHTILRCAIVDGTIRDGEDDAVEATWNAHRRLGLGRLCVVHDERAKVYKLSVEEDILFSPAWTQPDELRDLLARTLHGADQVSSRTVDAKPPAREPFDGLAGMVKRARPLLPPRYAIAASSDVIDVTLAGTRHQRIAVARVGPYIRLSSVVMGATRVERQGLAKALLSAWQRNRAIDVVDFTLDAKRRLVGEIDALADTLDAAELAFYIERLATECDRLEYVSSGRDEQ